MLWNAVFETSVEEPERDTIQPVQSTKLPDLLVKWLEADYLRSALEGAMMARSLLFRRSALSFSHDIDFGLVDVSQLGRMGAEEQDALKSWQRLMPTRMVCTLRSISKHLVLSVRPFMAGCIIMANQENLQSTKVFAIEQVPVLGHGQHVLTAASACRLRCMRCKCSLGYMMRHTCLHGKWSCAMTLRSQ